MPGSGCVGMLIEADRIKQPHSGREKRNLHFKGCLCRSSAAILRWSRAGVRGLNHLQNSSHRGPGRWLGSLWLPGGRRFRFPVGRGEVGVLVHVPGGHRARIRQYKGHRPARAGRGARHPDRHRLRGDRRPPAGADPRHIRLHPGEGLQAELRGIIYGLSTGNTPAKIFTIAFEDDFAAKLMSELGLGLPPRAGTSRWSRLDACRRPPAPPASSLPLSMCGRATVATASRQTTPPAGHGAGRRAQGPGRRARLWRCCSGGSAERAGSERWATRAPGGAQAGRGRWWYWSKAGSPVTQGCTAGLGHLADTRRPHDVDRGRPRALSPGAAPARGARRHPELRIPHGRLGPAAAYRPLRRHHHLRHRRGRRAGGHGGARNPPQAHRHRPGHRRPASRRRPGSADVGALRGDRLLPPCRTPLRLSADRRLRGREPRARPPNGPGPCQRPRRHGGARRYFEEMRPELARPPRPGKSTPLCADLPFTPCWCRRAWCCGGASRRSPTRVRPRTPTSCTAARRPRPPSSPAVCGPPGAWARAVARRSTSCAKTPPYWTTGMRRGLADEPSASTGAAGAALPPESGGPWRKPD